MRRKLAFPNVDSNRKHLYYFSCLGPSLLILGSPFLLLWNGIHLLLSPGAENTLFRVRTLLEWWNLTSCKVPVTVVGKTPCSPTSITTCITGFLFQIAIFSRFFECNYGDSGTPYDKIFGTFRDKLKESGTTYQGGSEEKANQKYT